MKTLRNLPSSAVLLLVLAGFCALVALSWVGFIGSDDVTYARGAYGWIEHFPYVGGHGTIRYPITIPLAISFLTVGSNEYALALPSLLYMLGTIAIAWQLVERHAGRRAAVMAAIVTITCPLFVVQGSIANTDMPELFFQLASFALFLRGLDEVRPAKWFFAAGLCAGLGFLTRETSIFIAGFYALLFFAGYRRPRTAYLWIVAGFLAVWAVELTYLGVMTGDPLYRVNISLHHDATIDRGVDLAGNLIVHPAIDPLLVLLFNQEFMLLFWMAIPAGLWLAWSGSRTKGDRAFIRLLGLYGLVIFVASGAAVKLLPLNPRYFSAPTLVACVMLGIALAHWWEHRKAATLLALCALLGANAAGIYVENRQSMFGVRAFADLAAAGTEPIYTDPMTHYRAELLLKWNGASNRAIAAPAPAGALYLWNPKLAETPNARMDAGVAPLFRQPAGTVMSVLRPRPDWVIRTIEASPLGNLVPAGIRTRLETRHPPVVLVRAKRGP